MCTACHLVSQTAKAISLYCYSQKNLWNKRRKPLGTNKVSVVSRCTHIKMSDVKKNLNFEISVVVLHQQWRRQLLFFSLVSRKMAYLPQAYANFSIWPGNEVHSACVMWCFFHLLQEGGGEEWSSHYLLDKILCYFSGYQLITSELINLHLSQTLFFNKTLIKEAG